MTTELSRLRPLPVAFVAPVVVALVVAIGQALHQTHAAFVPFAVIGACLAIILVAATPLLRRLDGDAPTIAALAVSASAIVLGVTAERAVDFAITSTTVSGLDELEVEVVMPWCAFAVFLAGLAAFVIHARVSAHVIARVLRIAAAGVLACGAAAVVFGAARTRTRPQPDDYVETLPIIASLGPMTTTGEHWVNRYGGYPLRLPIAPEENKELDGLITRRSCDDDGCWMQITTRASQDQSNHRWSIRATEPVTLRRDRAHDLVVFDYGSLRLWLSGTTADYAIPRIPRTAIGPPLRWIVGGALAVLVAAILFGWTPTPVRRARRAAHGKQGRSDGTRVTFDDGTPPFTPGRPITIGPVLVLSARAPALPTFREVGAIHGGDVLEGTLEELARAGDRALAARAALTIALVAIVCAPLFAY